METNTLWETNPAPRGYARKRRTGFLVVALIILAALVLVAFLRRDALLVWYCRLADYPENLVELLERNPETRDFVLAYRDQDRKESGPPQVTKGEIPLFLQWDTRWGYETYGSDILAITGCGPTCLSMVWCGLTGRADMTPDVMAQAAEGEGYYVPGAGTAWALMSEGAARLGLTVREVLASANVITESLRDGKVLICSMLPGDFTTEGHFIVLSGIDGAGNITVRDPNSILRSAKRWDAGTLARQMAAAWEYSY